MSKKTIIGTLCLFVFALVFSGCSQGKDTSDQKKPEASAEPKIEKQAEVPLGMTEGEIRELKGNVFENAPSASLVDVAGGEAEGEAWIAMKDGKTFHKAVASDLPELTNGDFYEGWLVKRPATGELFSTGKMIFDEGFEMWKLDFEIEGDKKDHRSVVITLEPDDGNPAPAGHILEGKFPPNASFPGKDILERGSTPEVELEEEG